MSNVKKIIRTGYLPRKHQELLHQCLKRFNVLVMHRRMGKTIFSLNEMIHRGLSLEKRNPQYCYIAPTYGQAKRVAWEILKDAVREIPSVIINEAELRVDIPRPWLGDKTRYMLLSAENPDSLRGLYLDGVILDEYAQCNPIIWTQVVRPALSDRLGWAIFIGTPKGTNHFHDIYQTSLKNKSGEWFSVIYKASETKIIPQDELDAAKEEMSDSEYEQEFECSFAAALVGSFYGKQVEELEQKGNIMSVPHDPALLVHTGWDLGIGDSTAIWFVQYYGMEKRIIDYVEMSGEALDYYARVLKGTDTTTDCAHRKKYTYGEHYLPHDAAARGLDSGKTREQTLRNLGIRGIVLPRDKIEDGINATRMMLPKCIFDINRCAKGLSALKNYQRKWDPKNKIFQNKPLHDWSSNGADALRTFAMGERGDRSPNYHGNLQRQCETDFDVLGY